MAPFHRWRRNIQTSNLISPNLISPLYHISPILSNLKSHGHYTCKTMVCQVLLCMNMPLKSSAIFYEKILILLKNLKKVYKGLVNPQKVRENFRGVRNVLSTMVCQNKGSCVYFESPPLASLTGLSLIFLAGDIGKNALRVTTLYNIPHKAPTALSNPTES